jgi:hypothetical protein
MEYPYNCGAGRRSQLLRDEREKNAFPAEKDESLYLGAIVLETDHPTYMDGDLAPIQMHR